jgi:hypothetical protein
MRKPARDVFIRLKPTRISVRLIGMIITVRIARLCGDRPFKFLTYQLSSVGYWPTEAMTGNGELGFDSGEGA